MAERLATLTAAAAPCLTAEQRQTVLAILRAVLPGAEVRVFGSRATGRARPFSDLDLLMLQPARLHWTQTAALRDAFEASDLPFRVDIVPLDDLAESYRERVMTECRRL